MVDTVHLRQAWRITSVHDGWKFDGRAPIRPTDEQQLEKFRVVVRHDNKQLVCYGPAADLITTIKVSSLATMLHGTNAFPLNGQREVDAALEVVELYLRQIATPIGPRIFERVDIVTHLQGIPFRELESALQYSSLPRSKAAVRRFGGESITFFRNRTELTFYDKVRKLVAMGELSAATWSCVRAELRLMKEDLDRELGGGKPVFELKVDQLYQVFRKHALSLSGAFPVGVKNIETYLAWLSRRNPYAVDVYLNYVVGEDRRKKLRRAIGRLASVVGDRAIPWDELFPQDHPADWPQIHYAHAPLDSKHARIVALAKKRHGLITDDAFESLCAKLKAGEKCPSEFESMVARGGRLDFPYSR